MDDTNYYSILNTMTNHSPTTMQSDTGDGHEYSGVSSGGSGSNSTSKGIKTKDNSINEDVKSTGDGLRFQR